MLEKETLTVFAIPFVLLSSVPIKGKKLMRYAGGASQNPFNPRRNTSSPFQESTLSGQSIFEGSKSDLVLCIIFWFSLRSLEDPASALLSRLGERFIAMSDGVACIGDNSAQLLSSFSLLPRTYKKSKTIK